jgi:hypothetical protein
MLTVQVHAYPSQNVFFANNVDISTRSYGIATNLTNYPSGNVDKTISFWFKQPPGLSFPNVQGLVSVFTGPGFPAYDPSTYPCSAEEMCFFQRIEYLQTGGACQVGNNKVYIGASNSMWYKSWNYFAYSYSSCGQSCGQGKAYLNGELVGTYDYLISRSGTNFMLGCAQGYYMTLYLDDLRVWSRTLSASEINNDFFSPTPQASALRIWYNFDSSSIGAKVSSDVVSGAVMNLYNDASIVSLSSAGCDGYYYVSGSTTLLPCTVSGLFCATCICAQSCSSPCPAGYYCPSGQKIACPAGTYCPAGSTIPTTCITGTYSTGGQQSSCTPCPVGFACASTSSAPVACLSSQFSLGNFTACLPCPAGFACASTISTPVPCLSGRYSLGNLTACLSCPASFACASTSLAPATCLHGQYSLGGQSSCALCPAGYSGLYFPRAFCTSVLYLIDFLWNILAGFFCNLSAAIPCPPGMYSPNNSTSSSSCQPCSSFPGVYSLLGDCVNGCPEGYVAQKGFCEGKMQLLQEPSQILHVI